MTVHYDDIQAQKSENVVVISKSGKNSEMPAFKNSYNRVGKRVFDVSIIVAALPFVLIIIALLAACVAIRGGAPFYTQDRIGYGGRVYRIWKLRTMIVNADAHLERHLAEDTAARSEWNTTQKLKNDPRITKFGRFLRRSSLDELPQLWNVLRGEMSLVGPRPMMPNQTELYTGTTYYNLRPGISGSWQVSARNASSFAERAVFDADYGQKVSLAEDVRILAATVKVVFRGTGY